LKRQATVLASISILLINVFVGIANASFAKPIPLVGETPGFARMVAASSERPEKDRFEALKPDGEDPRYDRYGEIMFRWGDVSWLPYLAAQAGWPPETHERLAEIVLRESGGCPNRRGGDMVDGRCRLKGVSEWNHRSDTGLLQINGVNYDPKRNKWAAVCREMGICTQEPLLDPLTNLKAGYLLYTYSGWNPWDPCTYGPKYAHRCKKKG